MTIRIETETPIPLAQVAHLPCIPRRRGKTGRLHPSTVWRWALKGVRGVRLEVVRVGGTLCTSAQALQRFFDRLADASPTGVEPHAHPAAPDQAGVERQLDALGVRAGGRRRIGGVHPPPGQV